MAQHQHLPAFSTSWTVVQGSLQEVLAPKPPCTSTATPSPADVTSRTAAAPPTLLTNDIESEPAATPLTNDTKSEAAPTPLTNDRESEPTATPLDDDIQSEAAPTPGIDDSESEPAPVVLKPPAGSRTQCELLFMLPSGAPQPSCMFIVSSARNYEVLVQEALDNKLSYVTTQRGRPATGVRAGRGLFMVDVDVTRLPSWNQLCIRLLSLTDKTACTLQRVHISYVSTRRPDSSMDLQGCTAASHPPEAGNSLGPSTAESASHTSVRPADVSPGIPQQAPAQSASLDWPPPADSARPEADMSTGGSASSGLSQAAGSARAEADMSTGRSASSGLSQAAELRLLLNSMMQPDPTTAQPLPPSLAVLQEKYMQGRVSHGNDPMRALTGALAKAVLAPAANHMPTVAGTQQQASRFQQMPQHLTGTSQAQQAQHAQQAQQRPQVPQTSTDEQGQQVPRSTADEQGQQVPRSTADEQGQQTHSTQQIQQASQANRGQQAQRTQQTQQAREAEQGQQAQQTQQAREAEQGQQAARDQASQQSGVESKLVVKIPEQCAGTEMVGRVGEREVTDSSVLDGNVLPGTDPAPWSTAAVQHVQSRAHAGTDITTPSALERLISGVQAGVRPSGQVGSITPNALSGLLAGFQAGMTPPPASNNMAPAALSGLIAGMQASVNPQAASSFGPLAALSALSGMQAQKGPHAGAGSMPPAALSNLFRAMQATVGASTKRDTSDGVINSTALSAATRPVSADSMPGAAKEATDVSQHNVTPTHGSTPSPSTLNAASHQLPYSDPPDVSPASQGGPPIPHDSTTAGSGQVPNAIRPQSSTPSPLAASLGAADAAPAPFQQIPDIPKHQRASSNDASLSIPTNAFHPLGPRSADGALPAAIPSTNTSMQGISNATANFRPQGPNPPRPSHPGQSVAGSLGTLLPAVLTQLYGEPKTNDPPPSDDMKAVLKELQRVNGRLGVIEEEVLKMNSVTVMTSRLVGLEKQLRERLQQLGESVEQMGHLQSSLEQQRQQWHEQKQEEQQRLHEGAQLLQECQNKGESEQPQREEQKGGRWQKEHAGKGQLQHEQDKREQQQKQQKERDGRVPQHQDEDTEPVAIRMANMLDLMEKQLTQLPSMVSGAVHSALASAGVQTGSFLSADTSYTGPVPGAAVSRQRPASPSPSTAATHLDLRGLQQAAGYSASVQAVSQQADPLCLREDTSGACVAHNETNLFFRQAEPGHPDGDDPGATECTALNITGAFLHQVEPSPADLDTAVSAEFAASNTASLFLCQPEPASSELYDVEPSTVCNEDIFFPTMTDIAHHHDQTPSKNRASLGGLSQAGGHFSRFAPHMAPFPTRGALRESPRYSSEARLAKKGILFPSLFGSVEAADISTQAGPLSASELSNDLAELARQSEELTGFWEQWDSPRSPALSHSALSLAGMPHGSQLQYGMLPTDYAAESARQSEGVCSSSMDKTGDGSSHGERGFGKTYAVPLSWQSPSQLMKHMSRRAALPASHSTPTNKQHLSHDTPHPPIVHSSFCAQLGGINGTQMPDTLQQLTQDQDMSEQISQEVTPNAGGFRGNLTGDPFAALSAHDEMRFEAQSVSCPHGVMPAETKARTCPVVDPVEVPYSSGHEVEPLCQNAAKEGTQPRRNSATGNAASCKDASVKDLLSQLPLHLPEQLPGFTASMRPPVLTDRRHSAHHMLQAMATGVAVPSHGSGLQFPVSADTLRASALVASGAQQRLGSRKPECGVARGSSGLVCKDVCGQDTEHSASSEEAVGAGNGRGERRTTGLLAGAPMAAPDMIQQAEGVESYKTEVSVVGEHLTEHGDSLVDNTVLELREQDNGGAHGLGPASVDSGPGDVFDLAALLGFVCEPESTTVPPLSDVDSQEQVGGKKHAVQVACDGLVQPGAGHAAMQPQAARLLEAAALGNARASNTAGNTCAHDLQRQDKHAPDAPGGVQVAVGRGTSSMLIEMSDDGDELGHNGHQPGESADPQHGEREDNVARIAPQSSNGALIKTPSNSGVTQMEWDLQFESDAPPAAPGTCVPLLPTTSSSGQQCSVATLTSSATGQKDVVGELLEELADMVHTSKVFLPDSLQGDVASTVVDSDHSCGIGRQVHCGESLGDGCVPGGRGAAGQVSHLAASKKASAPMM